MSETAPSERRTGLLIRVLADDLVGDFRRRHNALSVARRLPPHITVLFPFIPAESVSDETMAALSAHFSSFAPFEAELTGVGTFDRYVCLAPEPRSRFVDLITATCERFPDYPPYEGEGGEPEPHLTIAALAEEERTDRVEQLACSEFAAHLPFRFTVSGVSLFAELHDGIWQESHRFELG